MVTVCSAAAAARYNCTIAFLVALIRGHEHRGGGKSVAEAARQRAGGDPCWGSGIFLLTVSRHFSYFQIFIMMLLLVVWSYPLRLSRPFRLASATAGPLGVPV